MATMDRETKLEMLLKAAGLGQGEAANAVGIDGSRLSEWKARKWRMPVEVGVRLAKTLGTTAEYLADEALDEPPPALSDEARYLIRFIADVGFTPQEVVDLIGSEIRRRKLAPGVPVEPMPAGRDAAGVADQPRYDAAAPRDARPAPRKNHA
jgi:transcriptional regulator with XRE-family HTH domain